MSGKRTVPPVSFDKAIKFIGHFLSWYQESFRQSDTYNNLKLIDLVKEAEDIHTIRIKEIETFVHQKNKEYKKNVISTDKTPLSFSIKKPRRKRISKYL